MHYWLCITRGILRRALLHLLFSSAFFETSSVAVRWTKFLHLINKNFLSSNKNDFTDITLNIKVYSQFMSFISRSFSDFLSLSRSTIKSRVAAICPQVTLWGRNLVIYTVASAFPMRVMPMLGAKNASFPQ